MTESSGPPGHSAFTLPEDLAAGLRGSRARGTPLDALATPGRPILEDLSALPSDATYLATRGTAGALDRLGRARKLRALWASPVSDALLRALPRLPRLRAVYLG